MPKECFHSDVCRHSRSMNRAEREFEGRGVAEGGEGAAEGGEGVAEGGEWTELSMTGK